MSDSRKCIRTASAYVVTVLSAALCLLLLTVRPGFADTTDLDEEIRALESFTKTYHLIQSHYIESLDVKELVRFAIEGMVSRLDPYSEAFDKEALEELTSNATGRVAGIGLSIQRIEGETVVTQVIRNSPAEKAGLKPGDILVQLDQQQLAGQSETELNRLVSGTVGSPLTVSFHHPDQPDLIIEKTLIRELIRFPSILHFESDPSTIVIQIQQFQKNTPTEISAVLDHRHYHGIILDLRNNPGGLFLSAVETAELFIDRGEIVVTRDRENRLLERYVSRNSKPFNAARLVVIINRYTASSAEVLAGAIKDRGIGAVVGERSFGKGVVQTVFPLGDDLFVKLTTARYYTPSGLSFHDVGIEPDLPMVDTIRSRRYQPGDRLYHKALELVKGDAPKNGINR